MSSRPQEKSFISYLLGFCVVAQVLLIDLLSTVRNNLPSKVVDTLGSTFQNVNYKVEVNSFVGWAIAEVHGCW